jgi:hypothetical protein
VLSDVLCAKEDFRGCLNPRSYEGYVLIEVGQIAGKSELVVCYSMLVITRFTNHNPSLILFYLAVPL